MHSSIQYQMSQIHQGDLLRAAQRSEMIAEARGRAPRRSLRHLLALPRTRLRPAPASLRVPGRAAI